jgi:outer membrane protein assembly factor BamB
MALFQAHLAWALTACAAVLPLVGCGGRSDLESAGGATGPTGPTSPTDVDDPCPSAVSGPKPMAGSCSTRDGRMRARAPHAPHLTWSSTLPAVADSSFSVTTDASGHAYVLVVDDLYGSTALRRVEAASGVIDWTTPFSAIAQTSVPIVLSHGGVDLFAHGAPGGFSSFDPETGARTAAAFDLTPYASTPQDPAVGADGSLYITHFGVEGAPTAPIVSRVAPDGAVLWTSHDLGALVPGTSDAFTLTNVALGKDDLVVVDVSMAMSPMEAQAVVALDPATGAVRWSTPLPFSPMSPSSGPMVESDGTIAILVEAAAQGSNLVLLDPATGAPTTLAGPVLATGVSGVTKDGIFLVPWMGGLEAIAGDGTTLWNRTTSAGAILTSDDTVILVEEPLTAIDAASGTTKWQVSLGAAAGCVSDVALTSEGGLVGGCEGALFGAGD